MKGKNVTEFVKFMLYIYIFGGIIDMEKQYTIQDLIEILKILRGENGCPWDRVQTHETIKKSMIEETYEAIDALNKKDDKLFANELGDVLLQVVFHAQIADERGAFNFDDILNEICTKLITRHTHVFGADKAGNEDEALVNWEKNKKKEKNLKTVTDVLKDVPSYLPALMRAQKVQKKAESFGVVSDEEKLAELIREKACNINEENACADLLFYVTALAEKKGITAEIALADRVDSFISECETDERFKKM